MKIWSHAPGENWIIDEIVKVWNIHNSDISTSDPQQADVVWLAADFAWRNVPIEFLRKKIVVSTIHHIVPEKWNKASERDFYERDLITRAYHVPNFRTMEFIRSKTQKPVYCIPYWADQTRWFRSSESKNEIRKRMQIPFDKYVVFSAQRDTEGHDLISPKLEKGPDLLANALQSLSDKRDDVHVVLGGWRRQYIINRLKNMRLTWNYIELPSQNVVRDLYQSSDLYMITSRYEGGPQALLECGLMQLPCVSRPVGMAEEVLHLHSINENVIDANPSIPNVENLILPQGFNKYRQMFLDVIA